MADIKLNNVPLVTILIPCCNEKEAVLDRSLRSCSKIDYYNYKVILIENSTFSNIKYNNIEKAKKYKIDSLSMENKGSKASALNYAVNMVESEYFAVIDADQEVIPSILTILVKEILNNKKNVACVQTAQGYAHSNYNTLWSILSRLNNDIFYGYICSLYDKLNMQFCLGTNFIIRSSTIRSIGGFPDYSLTKDLALSFVLYRNKLRIKYLNIILGRGTLPHTFQSFFVQQFRIAKGTCQTFKREAVNIFKFPRFFIISLLINYLLGMVIIALLFICSNLIMKMPYEHIILLCIIFANVALTYNRGYKVFFIIITKIIQAPIHLMGIISGMIGYKGKFVVTPKEI